MTSLNPTDPFLQVQADVNSALQTTRPLFTSYLRIRSLSLPTSSTSPELSQARSALECSLADLSSDLQDLIDSVRAAEKDPFRYGLDLEEVGRRARAVEAVAAEVTGMRAELRDVVAGADRYARNSGHNPLPSPGAFEDDFDEEDEESWRGNARRREGREGEGAGEDGKDYEAWEQQRQVQIMHEQDEALDGVFQTVGNLRAQADVMGRELGEQDEMLGEVDGMADRVGGKLRGGLKRIEDVVRAGEDTWSSCCIGMLILVLLLLLVLVIAL